MKHGEDIEHIYLDDEVEPPRRHHERHSDLHTASESAVERKKVIRALIGVLLIAALLTTVRGWEAQRFLADFSATLLIAFAAFKFVHIEAFAWAYREYDLLASRIRPWGYTVPFVEAFLGFWYLLSAAPNRLNLLTLLVAAPAAFGARQALHHKPSVRHTSLGGVFAWPLVKLTYFEHAVVCVLAVAQLAT